MWVCKLGDVSCSPAGSVLNLNNSSSGGEPGSDQRSPSSAKLAGRSWRIDDAPYLSRSPSDIEAVIDDLDHSGGEDICWEHSHAENFPSGATLPAATSGPSNGTWPAALNRSNSKGKGDSENDHDATNTNTNTNSSRSNRNGQACSISTRARSPKTKAVVLNIPDLPALNQDGSGEVSEAALSSSCCFSMRKRLAETKLPLALRGLTASSRRDISMAARVHKGATCAIVLPPSVTPPSESQLVPYGLCQPPDTKGWYRLTDGSCIGLLQLDTSKVTLSKPGDDDRTWVNHGQARGFHHTQMRLIKLIEQWVPEDKQLELRNSAQGDYADTVWRLVPGLRYWPLSDVLVSRVLAWNVASERCRNISGACRLDRGARFLDLIRLHYGEEVSFLFGWHSNYLHMLAVFLFLALPFIVLRTSQGKGHIDRSMFPNSALTIIFGVLVTTVWDRRVKHLVHRWHVHGDATSRWQHMVLNLLVSKAKETATWDGYHLRSAMRTNTNRSLGPGGHSGKSYLSEGRGNGSKSNTNLSSSNSHSRFGNSRSGGAGGPSASPSGSASPRSALKKTTNNTITFDLQGHERAEVSINLDDNDENNKNRDDDQDNEDRHNRDNDESNDSSEINADNNGNNDSRTRRNNRTHHNSSNNSSADTSYEDEADGGEAEDAPRQPASSRIRWQVSHSNSTRGASFANIEQSAEEACRTAIGWEEFQLGSRYDRLKRLLKALIVVPLVLVEWTFILIFFTLIVWFEIWVIFDWGGCRDFNLANGDDSWSGCMSADQLRGYAGLIMGALPSICEGAFFELLLCISKFTAQSLISLYRFSTREQQEFAVVLIVFILEVVGKVGFISVLGLGFVPAWGTGHWTECRENWDYLLMGEWSLGCLKGQIPFEVRLKLFESCMKGPMLVSGLIGILLKVLLPILLEWWRRAIEYSSTDRCRCCQCRKSLIVKILMAPLDFVLKVTLLIFQADGRAVQGPKLICKFPPTLEPNACPITVEDTEAPTSARPYISISNRNEDLQVSTRSAAAAEEWAKTKRARMQDVLLEGDRREYQPFDEYIELLLHFLWTSCFAIVWPLGILMAVGNQFLELRFDCVKLLVTRRRRFPSTRHMSVVWVPRCALIVCHISIVVNVLLLLLPYRQLATWYPEGCAGDLTISTTSLGLTACTLPKIAAAFGVTWLGFLLLRIIILWVVRRLLRGHDSLAGALLHLLLVLTCQRRRRQPRVSRSASSRSEVDSQPQGLPRNMTNVPSWLSPARAFSAATTAAAKMMAFGGGGSAKDRQEATQSVAETSSPSPSVRTARSTNRSNSIRGILSEFSAAFSAATSVRSPSSLGGRVPTDPSIDSLGMRCNSRRAPSLDS